MDITHSPVKATCRTFLQKAIQQHRHYLKKQYFHNRHLIDIPKESPVRTMTNLEWIELVQHWMNPESIFSPLRNQSCCIVHAYLYRY